MQNHIMKLAKTLYPALIDKLKLFGSQTYKIVETIQLAVSGIRGVDVYTDGWPQFTTTLAELTWPEFCEDSFGLFTTDTEKCRKFLQDSQIVDWTNKHSFGGIQPNVAAVLKDIGLKKGFNYRINGPYLMMHLTSNGLSDTTHVSLPSTYRSSTLHPTDAACVTSHWQYAEPGTEDFVRFIIENFSTVCVKDDEDSLVGWYMQQPYGAMGMLHVLDAHRGKGLAKYMTVNMGKKLISRGQIPYGYISESNVVSLRLHEECGATIVDDNLGQTGHMWVISPSNNQR